MPTAHSQTRTRTALVLAVLAFVAFLATGYVGYTLDHLGKGLETAAAPGQIISLELAATDDEARQILREWRRHPRHGGDVTGQVRQAMARDFWFVVAYVLLGVLLALSAGLMAHLPWFIITIVVGLFAAAGGLDLAENAQIEKTLKAGPDGVFGTSVMLTRLYAMSKFTVLLFAAAATLAAAGGALRTVVGRRGQAGASDPTVQHFEHLVRLETAGIFFDPNKRTKDYPDCTIHRPADEQYVSFRAADVIGLSLSGGGIRSATFNLGLLQGLHRLKLLRLFDYVSTVSGGGYVGSFWSEWLVRQAEKTGPLAPVGDENLFPTKRPRSTGRGHLDTDQERHLREFSGFLAPRLGFFEVEMWTAIVAVLGGLVPALLMGLSVLGVALIAWLALTFPLASPSDLAAPAMLGVITLVVLLAFENVWQTFREESAGRARQPTEEEFASARRATRWYLYVALVTVALVTGVQAMLPAFYDGPWPIYTRSGETGWHQAAGAGLVRWWAITGISNPGTPWVFSPRLFDFGLACIGTAAVLLLVRVWAAVRPWRRETLSAFDRVLMRVLGLGVFWTGIAGLWHVSMNLAGFATGAAGAAAVSGGAFAALRNWIGVSLRRPAEAGLTDRLKPYLPQVLAYVTIALSAAAIGALLIWVCDTNWLRWWTAAAAMMTALVMALFIETEEFGLHAFYRDRISRAYAGACNLAEGEGAADNRGTEPQDADDRKMTDLVGRPLHLVCCAANDLSGDQVETLSRGARSAVLSKYGFSLGRYFHAWPDSTRQKLGSAITASAAAFNSNMGQVSMRLGPAVSFLMTTLNLRLGLWLRHPAAPAVTARRWPGLLLYREMFGLTSASGRLNADGRPSMYLSDVHLSDGGHFENLALYELIRRHCRYVLVSDCGADPTVAFDDLGNVLRRVREDFGVDITLDVAPLRPRADGISLQHVAVGTIHYSDTDRGILLYVKPSITGDEPTDVLQYRTRNEAFPHEGTGDQFYDEAQWESYRRLGLHAADCVFEFVAREGEAAHTRTADWVFAEAMHRWGTTPPGLEERVLEMTQRFSALETELQERSPDSLLEEVFPEIAQTAVRQVYATSRVATRPGRVPPPADRTALTSNLAFLMRVIQLMEDAWLTCKLDAWWSHPLNLGWINLFARWATSEEFRFWWPLLSPMFSPGFRSFIQYRFPIAAGSIPQQGRVVALTKGLPSEPGLAEIWLEQRSSQTFSWQAARHRECTRRFYQNLLDLWRKNGKFVPIQAGIAGVTCHGEHVGWTSHDFFVPPSLWGAGIGWHFLKSLLLAEHAAGSKWCYVVVKLPGEGSSHQVARDDYRSFLEQYRKIGFRELREGGNPSGGPDDKTLWTELGFNAARQDTLLELDLDQWQKRQD